MFMFLVGLMAIFGFSILLTGIIIFLVAQILVLGHRRRKHSHRLVVQFYVGGERMTAMNLKDSQQVSVTAALEDAKGNPTTGAGFDAPPVWGLDDASFGDLTVSDDGLTAELVPNGKLGVCHIQFSASLAGKALVATSEDINIVAGDATQVGLVLGTPEDQPAPVVTAPDAPVAP